MLSSLIRLPTLLAMIGSMIAVEPIAYTPKRSTIPIGPHPRVLIERDVVYWADQPPVPDELREKGEGTNIRRPWMHVLRADGVAGPRPGVILIHGGGYAQGSPDFSIDPGGEQLGVLLASHGYNVYCAGYTLKTRAGKYLATIDLRQTVRFIKANAERFGQDPERLAAWGYSAGAMTLSQFLDTGDGQRNRLDYGAADGRKVREEVVFDGGPLAESGIGSRLRVMVFSSGFDIRSGELARKIEDNKSGLPTAIITYQSPGEKPGGVGRIPDSHEVVKTFTAAGVTYEGYGVPTGKHCPGLGLKVTEAADSPIVWEAVAAFLDQHLREARKP